ncbi:uncharacterized protein LOC126638793 [Myiozetetes cayanensis]|uniref:uncharacterized protein LOC126638793 n=1 Tax=Myiozetetes cayanensis TaxID=478635 RepID=UPI00215F4CA6|nr:uncharacterized protein LOC126638793 [Myiozetetes cayanensis]
MNGGARTLRLSPGSFVTVIAPPLPTGRRDPEAVSKRRNRSLSERDKTLGKSLWAPRRSRPPPLSRSAGSLLPAGARPAPGKAPALKEPIGGVTEVLRGVLLLAEAGAAGVKTLAIPPEQGLRWDPLPGAGAGVPVPAPGPTRGSYQPNTSQKGHLLNEQRAEASPISPWSPISSVSPSPPPAHPRSAPEGNLLWFGWFSSLGKG